MKRLVLGLAMLGLASLGATAAAHAQGARFGLGGGLAAPTGDYGSADKGGWHALAKVDFAIPMAPVGIRVDALYGRTSHKDQSGSPVPGNTQLAGGLASLVWNVPARAPMFKHRSPGRDVPYEAGETASELCVPRNGRAALVLVTGTPVQRVDADADGGHRDREIDLGERVPATLVRAAVVPRRSGEPAAETKARALRVGCRGRPKRLQPEHSETQHQAFHGTLRFR